MDFADAARDDPARAGPQVEDRSVPRRETRIDRQVALQQASAPVTVS